jgi:hypothetical protein
MTLPVSYYPASVSTGQAKGIISDESSRQHSQFPQTHLVVLQHGLWGSITDLENVSAVLRSRFGNSARVIRSGVNGVQFKLEARAPVLVRLGVHVLL